MSIEKNSVLGNGGMTKSASSRASCPQCGSPLDFLGSLPRCPVHGTAPFEAESHIRKKSNEERES